MFAITTSSVLMLNYMSVYDTQFIVFILSNSTNPLLSSTVILNMVSRHKDFSVGMQIKHFSGVPVLDGVR